MTRTTKWFAGIMGAVFALILALKLLELYTDFLWMESLGQSAVFSTILWTKLALALVAAVVFFAILYPNLRIARRPLPPDVTIIGRRLLPEEEREQIEQYADKGLLLFTIIGALMAGATASGKWLDWQTFANAVPFGSVDPLFGIDIGFYLLKLPFIEYAWRTVFYTVVIAFVASVLISMYMETIRVVGNTVHAAPKARAHAFTLLAVILVLKVYGYRLAQYNLLYSTRGGNFSGASYADVHAKLPFLYVMMALALIAAVIILVTARGRSFKIPGWTIAALVVAGVLGGSVYPAAIQRIVVEPVGPKKERPYILHNIRATNEAFGLNAVERQTFVTSKGKVDPGIVSRNPQTIENIRLWDHRPLQRTYDRQQTLDSPFYHFVDVDVDRYVVGGRLRQTMVSARQIDYGKLPSRTWANEHLVYTHGYGVCLSPVNEKTADGLPYYWIRDIPPRGPAELRIDRPQLYFQAANLPRLIELISPPERRPEPPPQQEPGGQPGAPGGAPTRRAQAPARTSHVVQNPYTVVNTVIDEFDYPQVTGGVGTGQYAATRYAGKGGVRISGFLRRLAFAARFQSKDLLFTSAISADSRIIFNHLMPNGLVPLAPFLAYDPDPYITIVDGHLKWICDAYTWSSRYPYSARLERGWPQWNYVRNSVKVVVDAYDGIPEYYVVDPDDPMVRCYQKIFPTLFRSGDQVSPEIRSHWRYPALMFMMQAMVYKDYHMGDPDNFYSRADAWDMPVELYDETRRQMEAYYVNMKLPGEAKEEFLLMLPFTPRGRVERNMVAWMAARCDGDNYGKLLVYQFPKTGEESGEMGPLMAEAMISQDPNISASFTLWGQSGSRVIRGNLLVIPIEDSILYVEPIYIESAEQGDGTQGAIPQLQAVVVLFRGRVAMEATLDKALAAVFGTEAPAEAVPAVSAPTAPQGADVKTLIGRAVQMGAEAEQLLKRGDLAGYQKKLADQQELLRQVQQMLQ